MSREYKVPTYILALIAFSLMYSSVRGEEPHNIGGTLDEPTGSGFLEVDTLQSCPGFYVLRTHPGVGSQAGRIGTELRLRGQGSRTLQGGLNFGGRATISVSGFAAFNITNRANENQNLSLEVQTGAAGSLTLQQRSGGEVIAEPLRQNLEGGLFTTTITVPPGFYVLSFLPESQDSVSFNIAANTSYVDRRGGGFQGGVVIGGYHDPSRASGTTFSTSFAGFCISEAQDIEVQTLAWPTYGSSSARNLEFSVTRSNADTVLDSLAGPQSGSLNGWRVTRLQDAIDDTVSCFLRKSIGTRDGLTASVGFRALSWPPGSRSGFAPFPEPDLEPPLFNNAYCGASACYGTNSGNSQVRVDSLNAREFFDLNTETMRENRERFLAGEPLVMTTAQSPDRYQGLFDELLTGESLTARVWPNNQFFPIITGTVSLDGFAEMLRVFDNCSANRPIIDP